MKYQAWNLEMTEMIAEGNTLADVEKMGERIIIDTKKKRTYRQGVYPTNVRWWKPITKGE
jgi:hypothetical protein